MTAMAEDGMLPSYFSRSANGEKVSHRTLTVFTVLMLLQYFGMGTFQRLLNYVMFTDSLSLAFGAACIYVFMKKSGNSSSTATTPKARIFQILLPAIFIFIMLVVTVNVTISEPDNALAGLAVFIVGASVYLLRRRLIIKGIKV